MGKETLNQVQEVQKVPSKINPKKNLPRHSNKLTKIKEKEKLLKATREKQQIMYKGTPKRLSADFSAENLQARREWHNIFKVMKEKKLQPRMLYASRLSFRFAGEVKSFIDKQRLREFSTTKQALGFPHGSEGKSICLQCGRPGINPWIGKIPLEKEMATHPSTLAWKIPWTEEPGSLQSMGSQRVGYD